ncbi:MAG: protein phosphatase 2C domain-containing protein [Candidatus Obscuribacter sp.]|jgi:serine/threonine protein phosphatase PrpC|nr:protein phosphatase 2C domain-containing protein [Candidatus Obscuribacter sp.]MBK9771907.1 protein phosphatase 2C domain-containing protein [Candidatus Obscuribacter sp.]
MKDCPACKVPQEDTAKFCEDCGSSMSGQAVAATESGAGDSAVKSAKSPATNLCSNCGAGPTAIDDDGFCTQCGHSRKHPDRDHFEVVLDSKVAGVSDRGIRHHQNEDYFAIGKGSPLGTDGKPTSETALALVVCDGVSQSQNPQDGSSIGATTARDYLLGAIARGYTSPETTITEALVEAQKAICTVPFNPAGKNDRGETIAPAQATIVAALAQGKRITIGWLGDSRAYWLTGTSCVQISRDHSWYNEVVDAGLKTRQEALADPQAHAITRSLGAAMDGSNPGVEPSFRTLNLTEKGTLLVVSDGFWNYADSEGAVLKLVNDQPAQLDPLSLARRLVQFAYDKGGKDNITVVVAKF